MADAKLTALTAETTVATTEIVYFVDDPGGTPLSRKCTIANLTKGIDLTNAPQASGVVTIEPASGSDFVVTLATTGDMVVNTTDLVVDTSENAVGVGIATPACRLQVVESGTPPSLGSAVVMSIQRSADCIVSIVGGNTSSSFLDFGDTDSAVIGRIRYNHSSDSMNFRTNGVDDRVVISSDGNVGVGTGSPTEILDVNGDCVRIRTAQTPASASATGTQGQFAWDASYFYICTATNTWRRVAHSTW